jgi:hypothetical protein
MPSGGHHNQEFIMRKTLFAFVFSVCAGAASASNILNASGVADTSLTAVNETVNGDAVGVWGQAMEVDGMNGYRGTAIRADGFHYGLDLKAGPGDGYHVRGALIDATGSAQAGDVWGIESNVQGYDWAYGYDTYTTGAQGIGYRANVSGNGEASGFMTTGVNASNGNAYGLNLYGATGAIDGNAYGAYLGQVTATNGYGWAIDVDVTSDLNAHGFSADYITSNNGDAYGVRLHSVTAANVSHGVSANAYGNNVTYGGAFYGGSNSSVGYGVYSVGNAYSNNAYGLYGTAYSEYGDGIGIYAYGSSNYGNSVAAFLDGDVYASGGSCTYCSPSDQMFKKNIQPLSGGLKTVMALKPKTYEMKTDEYKDRITLAKGKQRGFIAQELKEVLPDMVHEVTWPARLTDEERKKGVKKEGTKFNAVSYMDLIPVLVQAVQEQQAVIKALEDKVARLEAR